MFRGEISVSFFSAASLRARVTNGIEVIKIALLLQTGDVRHDGACFRKTAADKKFLERRGSYHATHGLQRDAAGGEVEHRI